MAKTSIIIPSRNEKFLSQTVADIFLHATGDIECIVILDGYWPDPPLEDRKNLILIHRGQAKGMRSGINSAVAIAKGEYLMKCDAHCMFAEGFDEVLKVDCEDNWIVIPRRMSLNAETWTAHKEPIDAMHYFYPYLHPDDLGLHGRPWMERSRERKDILIDEDITFQGSAWFMKAEHFNNHIGGMSEVGYETFMGEPQEIGFKTQLGECEGKIMVNKKTWYAHLHKGHTYGRMYSMSQSERVRGNAYSFDLWWNNKWAERVHDLSWLIRRFWPHPGWPENWEELAYGNA